MKSLLNCIQCTVNTGFGATVETATYNRVNAQFKLNEAHGNQYAVCGITCLGTLAAWAARQSIKRSDIQCIFERGDEGQENFIEFALSQGFNISKAPKEKIRAFDACDILAWKVRTLIDNSLVTQLQLTDAKAAAKIMRTFDELEPILPGGKNGRLTEPSLLRICREIGVPKRESST